MNTVAVAPNGMTVIHQEEVISPAHIVHNNKLKVQTVQIIPIHQNAAMWFPLTHIQTRLLILMILQIQSGMMQTVVSLIIKIIPIFQNLLVHNARSRAANNQVHL